MHPIFIMTYGRPYTQRTWCTLNPELRSNVVFAVREEELEIFHKTYSEATTYVLPPSCTNLRTTRQHLYDHCVHTYEYWFQLDDDITRFETLTRDPVTKVESNRRLLSLEDQQSMFDEMIAELKTHGAGLTSPRPSHLMPKAEFPRKSASLVTGFYTFNGPVLRDLTVRFSDWDYCGDTNAVFDILSQGIDTTFRMDYKYHILSGTDVEAPIRRNSIQERDQMIARWCPYITYNNRKDKTGRKKDCDPRLHPFSNYTQWRSRLLKQRPGISKNFDVQQRQSLLSEILS